ncbi:MAG: tetratricopeptide repeat protein [Flavobacteriales bacterium]
MTHTTTIKNCLAILLIAFMASTINSCTDSKASGNEKMNVQAGEYQLPELLTRQGELAATAEWQKTLEAVNTTKEKIKNNPQDFASYIKLAEIFINEARVTGEHGHYYPAILGLIENLQSKKPDNEILFRALTLKSSVYLSLHQFATAKECATQAVQLNANNAQIYGALVDANVELGNYAEAVKMAEKMMEIRPDLISYSRASYLREIHGDPKGAIQAMNLAVESGYAGYENLAWTRNTLGEIHETYGDIMNAEVQYKTTLQERPGYPFAIAGLASVEKKKGNVEEAEKLLNQACAIIPEVSFYADLASIYKETGRKELADKTIIEVLAMMADDEAKGHVMNLEYAKLYMNLIEDNNKALEYAMKEYEVRPMNIDVNNVLAEIYYNKGDLVKAEEHLALAMSTNSQNPELLMIAGLIYTANGNKTQGEQLVKQANESNPYLNGEFAIETTNRIVASR